MSHRGLVGDVAVLFEAGLTLLLLGWHVVGDVRVVALLGEPVNEDDEDDDDTEVDDDDKVNQRPVLTSDPVVPNCLLNLNI